jgi:hypothetical protein
LQKQKAGNVKTKRRAVKMANLHEQNVQPAWSSICSVEEQREVIRRPTNKKRYEDKEKCSC